MQIEIKGNKFILNGQEMHFPLNILQLKNLLGESRHVEKKYNHIYTWDDSGILAYSKNGSDVESLVLEPVVDKFDFSSTTPFTAPFIINETDYRSYIKQHESSVRKVNKRDRGGTLTIGDFDLWIDMQESPVTRISIGQHVPPPVKVYSDKYKYQPIEGEKIEFTDFNFKLAVIQVLMYNKALLTPKFELYDFVKNYAAREIDIEEEGYEFIPEVTAWFEALEIDKQLAPEITDISQDGGDNIYGHMLRFWDGEDDTFNITNFDDVRHFPNLKRMNLFYADNLKEIAANLAEKGIIVESI